MSDLLKHLAERLNRQYNAIVGRPMPWRMIDALSTLEEKLEEREQDREAPSDNGRVSPNHPSLPQPPDRNPSFRR